MLHHMPGGGMLVSIYGTFGGPPDWIAEFHCWDSHHTPGGVPDDGHIVHCDMYGPVEGWTGGGAFH